MFNEDITKVLMKHDNKRNTFDFVWLDDTNIIEPREAAEYLINSITDSGASDSNLQFLQFEQCSMWDGVVWADNTYVAVIPEEDISDMANGVFTWFNLDDPHLGVFGTKENALTVIRRSLEMAVLKRMGR